MTENCVQDKNTEAVTEPRDFGAFLLDVNRGESHRELSQGLADLVAAVIRTGKPGTLTYTVRVEPASGNDAIVTVTDKIGGKTPEGERRTSIFYVDNSSNSLVRHNPYQESLFGINGDNNS
ncbi:hypothetical protein GCM10010174_61970 [Kutzneria viridogrisea]|uniref:Uncharacterized protein n=1 Tax=Kutzneria viridogrisea TaxID=47990 RepID=A0ABR6BGK0_9PSEU|nr:hypothetical protein [Kutzneria viridogrisea]